MSSALLNNPSEIERLVKESESGAECKLWFFLFWPQNVIADKMKL